MALDTSIPLSLKPVEFESPLSQYAKLLQFQNANNENQLNKLKINATQAELQDDARLKEYLKSVSDFSDPSVINKLNSFGTSGAELVNKLGVQNKNKSEVDKGKSDLIGLELQRSKDDLAQVDSVQGLSDYVTGLHTNPVLGPYLDAKGMTLDHSKNIIRQSLTVPGGFRRLLNEMKLGSEKVLQNHYENQDLGGYKQIVQLPSYGDAIAKVVPGSKTPVTQSPNVNKTLINVNAYTPASEEIQKEYSKSSRATYDTLKQTPVVLANLEEAKKLIPSAKSFMGTGGEPLLNAVSFLNNRLGMNIDTKGVTGAEELRSRMFMQIMDNLKKMDAQPSERQQAALQQALGTLGTDPKALPRILDSFGNAIRGKVDLYNKEVKSAQDRGVVFPYDPVISLKSQNSVSNLPKPGDIVDGYKYMGGNRANKANWKKVK